MFNNKHVITALIVAPILAVLSYYAVDYLVSERPHQAVSGGQYQLAQLPSCRYASGQCVLQNGDFKIIVTGHTSINGDLLLQLESVFPLDSAFVSVVSDSSKTVAPEMMAVSSDDGKKWRIKLAVFDPFDQYLRLAVSAQDAVYYAETTMPFLNYETSYNKDFRD